MEISLYEICAKAAAHSLLTALTKDPLRGIMTAPGKRAFLKDVRESVRRQGFPSTIEVDLRGSAPTVSIKIHDPDVRTVNHEIVKYEAVIGLHALTEMLDLGRSVKIRIPN